MKAIFAVSALAAAISAQAIAADTEATWSFTGEVNVGSVIDIEGEDRYHTATKGDDGWNLDATLDIANGGFKGSLGIEGSDGAAAVTMGDLSYEEGAILFGNLDSIITTEGQVDEMSDDLDYGVDVGFRYTTDFGLVVQAENGATIHQDTDGDADVDGDDTATGMTDFGLAAAYSADLGVATVAADVQYRESSNNTTVLPVAAPVASADEALALYAGVLVTATPVDMLTVKANYNTGHSVDAAGATFYDADTTVSQWGVRADATVAEGITAYAYTSAVGDADANTKVGAAAAFGPVSVEASYHVTNAEAWGKVSLSEDMEVSEQLTVGAYAEATYTMPENVDATLEWAAGVNAGYAISEMLSASASFDVEEDGNDATDVGTKLAANLTYTTEGGASLTADYLNRSADFTDGLEHTVTLKAAYSF